MTIELHNFPSKACWTRGKIAPNEYCPAVVVDSRSEEGKCSLKDCISAAAARGCSWGREVVREITMICSSREAAAGGVSEEKGVSHF